MNIDYYTIAYLSQTTSNFHIWIHMKLLAPTITDSSTDLSEPLGQKRQILPVDVFFLIKHLLRTHFLSQRAVERRW